jgi:hypothetical protein
VFEKEKRHHYLSVPHCLSLILGLLIGVSFIFSFSLYHFLSLLFSSFHFKLACAVIPGPTSTRRFVHKGFGHITTTGLVTDDTRTRIFELRIYAVFFFSLLHTCANKMHTSLHKKPEKEKYIILGRRNLLEARINMSLASHYKRGRQAQVEIGKEYMTALSTWIKRAAAMPAACETG